MKHLLILLMGITACMMTLPCPALEKVPEKDLENVLRNAVNALRNAQNQDGSFGTTQQHLQTSLAILAFVSRGKLDTDQDLKAVENACRYLEKSATRNGDMADDIFQTESHALAVTALLSALPHLEDPKLRKDTSKIIYRGLKLLQRWQDRSSSSGSRGGWKMTGAKGRENDRRASAWALLAYETARLYGLDIKSANLKRGLHFLLASFKQTDDKADQIGGLSVDLQGLCVSSVSSMGGWFLQRDRDQTKDAQLNVAWLKRHPPMWQGPNYFYENFFRVRTLKFAQDSDAIFQRAFRQIFLQIREHQLPDGAVSFPPGNAQNTVAMGPAFSTSLAILILNVQNSNLVFDQDWVLKPLIQTENKGATQD